MQNCGKPIGAFWLTAVVLFAVGCAFSGAGSEDSSPDTTAADDTANETDDTGDDDGEEALRLRISPEKPLFIFNIYGGSNSDQVRTFADLLPEDVRPFFGLQLIPEHRDTPETRAWIQEMMSAAEDLGFPTFIQAESFNSHNDTPSSYWLDLFDRFPLLVGLCVAEFSADGLTIFNMSPDRIRRVKNYLDLVASRHAFLLWQDMGYEWSRWGLTVPHVFLKAGADEGLYKKIVEHGRHLILQDKHNGKGRRFTGPAAILGFWTTGLIDYWGVNSEDWIWWEAGYGHLYEPSSGLARTEDDWKTVFSFPDAQFGMDWLLALSAGATVYSLETPYHGIADLGCGSLTPAFEKVLLPLIRLMITRPMIPSRERVLEKIRVAYRPLEVDPKELHNDNLFRNLYGPEDNSLFEWMPSTGRYYFLPILPVRADASLIDLFPEVFDSAFYAAQFSDSSAKVDYFDARYPAAGSGDAWFQAMGAYHFIVNPNENADITAAFDFPFDTGLTSDLSGTLSPHTFAIAWEEDDAVRVHLSNYRIDSEADVWSNDNLAEDDPGTYICNQYIPHPTDSELRLSRMVFSGMAEEPSVDFQCGYLCETTTSFDGNDFTVDIRHSGTADIVLTAP